VRHHVAHHPRHRALIRTQRPRRVLEPLVPAHLARRSDLAGPDVAAAHAVAL